MHPVELNTVGLYREPVAVLDFASLYPSLYRAYNLCYSTLIHPEDAAIITQDDTTEVSLLHHLLRRQRDGLEVLSFPVVSTLQRMPGLADGSGALQLPSHTSAAVRLPGGVCVDSIPGVVWHCCSAWQAECCCAVCFECSAACCCCMWPGTARLWPSIK